ncbi:MAG: helix-hairpin-helix domain-containing protein [Patescibacteria group bacterium]
MSINLKHWIGTLIVAIIAGFVIFGLVRGQEFLANFLINRELKKIEKEQEKIRLPYQENIQIPLVQNIIKTTPKNTPSKSTFLPTPTPQISILPTPSPSPTLTFGSTPKQSDKININTANVSELEKITGVGPVIAKRIIDYRNTYGPFKKIEDIKNIKGIGDVNFEKMKDEITVE